MDFDKEHLQKKGFGKYESLDASKLPKLYLAYKTDLSKVSGKVLNDIKTRYEQGDTHTIDTLKHIASLAEKGREAILNGDTSTLSRLINENFDNRCKIMNISDSNMELVQTARACGVSAKFTGSGGSIIGTYSDEETLKRLVFAMKKIHARVIKPIVI
jgi:glucuronokinase